jgi:hypothetical protein
MNTTLRVAIFGVVSGLVWSVIVFHPSALLSSSAASALIVLATSIATGVAVSFALRFPLARSSWWLSVFFGLLALPLAALVYGFLFGLLCVVGQHGGERQAGLPFVYGFYGMFVSVISMYYLFPVAILTTLCLRVLIRGDKKEEHAA